MIRGSRLGTILIAMALTAAACGGDDGATSAPGVCAPTATIRLASEANGLKTTWPGAS